MTNFKQGAAGAIAAAMAMLGAPTALAQDKFDVFNTHNEASTQSVSYAEFDEFLRVFSVRKGGRLTFNYSAMRPQGVRYLNAYATSLSGLTPSQWSRQEQLAYWLNLHNVLVIRAIAAQSPGRSLKDERWDGDEPGEMWTRKRLSVEGVSLSIDDIEQKILFSKFDNPNIIYGLYQGVRGGPNMSPVSFTGANVEQELKSLGEDFVNNRKNVRVRSANVRVSLIYHWYKDAAFDGDDGKIIEHVRSLAKSGLQGDLEDVTSVGEQRFSYAVDEYEVRQQIPQQGFSGGGARGS